MNRILLITLMTFSLAASAQNHHFANENLAATAPSEPAGAVSGRVRTNDNKPAAYVNLSLRGTNRVATTDEDGKFYFAGVKEGSYQLEISMAGLKSQIKTVEIRKNQETVVDISLDEDAKQLETVTVTARRNLNSRTVSIGKIAVDPMDLPQALTTIGQATIRDQQAGRLSEVVRNVNGVYLTTTRGAVQESFAARGYGFSSSNLYKNGFRVNSGVMPEVSGLEKVEVLKGSASILYGQVAPGGVLNMVTKQPKFEFGGEVSMRAGSYDLYKPSFDIYGPISSKIAYRLNGTYESAGSFRKSVSSSRYYVNPSLLFRLGSKTELVLEGDFLKHDFTPDFGIGSLDNTKITNVDRSTFFGTPWQYNTTTQSTGTATVRHQFSEKWRLDVSASYQDYDRDYFSTERIQAAANGDWTRPLGKIDQQENYYAAQANLIGKINTGSVQHAILAGVDADRNVTRNFDFTFPAVAGLPAGSYDRINLLDPGKFVARTDEPASTRVRKRVAPINRFGAYVQDLVKITPKLNLLVGVRWSYVGTGAIDSLNLLNNVATTGKSRSDKAFSPRVGIVFKPFTNTSVFASYANSFNVNTGTDVDGKSLTPSIIDQYELGVKNDFFQGRLSANLTLYRIINNNLAQTAPFLKDGVTQNTNANIKVLSGQTTSDGIEIDLSSQPIIGLSILAGYSYNNIRYTRVDSVKGNFIEGERLVNNPQHTANGSVFYTFSGKFLKGVKIGAAAFYTGQRISGWNNTIGQTQNYNRQIPVEGFTTIDISAGYTYKSWSLLAKVSNIGDVLNYNVHENYSVNPINPRQFVGTIAYRF